MDIYYRLLLSKAFGAGSDARVQGIPLEENPHEVNTPIYLQWKMGWKDVDKNWGKNTDYRWCVTPLPEVKRCPNAHAIQQSETFSSLPFRRHVTDSDSVKERR